MPARGATGQWWRTTYVPRSHAVWLLLAAGLIVRLVLAFSTGGQPYDIESLLLTRHALGHSLLHAYAVLDVPGQGFRWPYPAGYFPFLSAAALAGKVSGLAYTSLLRIPSILADTAIAWIVQDFLGRRGASDRERLTATTLIALGPSFILISGYHGQIDGTAILPAVAALVVWERAPEDRRAMYAGALIGVGGAIKTTPLLMLLALVPAARSWRQATTLIVTAISIPLAVTAPFLITTPSSVIHALGYRGFPGTSGLSILLQPALGGLLTHQVTLNPSAMFLYDHGGLILLAALLAVTVGFWRAAPIDRAVLLWLAFYIVTPVFFFQYLVWGLPFVLLARRLRLALGIQLIALTPAAIFYFASSRTSDFVAPYVAGMLALWVLLVVAFAWLARNSPAGGFRWPLSGGRGAARERAG